MNEEILKRKMFSEPMSKKAMNVGIMQGFEDEMEEEGELEEMPPMARSPQNPEILMNNLRGDMRSVDARYMELAQMVGEQAAMDTPPEVLAMLQPQLASQQMPPAPPGGIGSLQPQQEAPQGAPEGAPTMPPGMEGAAPFPPGGAEQAPPTPDGLPPLRAKDGVFVTPEARTSSYTGDSPRSFPNLSGSLPERLGRPDMLQMRMNRMLELASGNIPPEQMTEEDRQLLQQYNMSMGFTGGTIRDIAKQGASRIGGALAPYMIKGEEAFSRGLSRVDDYLGGFLPPSFRVVPMRDKLLSPTAKGRATLPARESIVEGPGGVPTMGTGTKLTPANTLDVGRVPFSQAFRESLRQNPKSTIAAGTAAGGTAAAMLSNMVGGGGGAPRSAEDIARVNALIDQIPPTYTAAEEAEMAMQPPSQATINRVMAEEEADLSTPFSNLIEPPPKRGEPETRYMGPAPGTGATTPIIPPTPEQKKEETVTEFIQDKMKEESPAVIKTRAQRIKEESEALMPTFKEILGDTKSDVRTNALLLLADAGFKFASTYKPTAAMAFAESFSGVPRGFAALVAQARDRDIKIKTSVLQQAVDNVNLQDKLARDYQIEGLKIQGRVLTEGIKARSAEALERLKASGKWRETVYNGDIDILREQIRTGGVVEKDAGMGLVTQETKGGSFIGSYIKPDKNGNLPPVVVSAISSPYTLRETDNPFVTNRGPAPTTVETDKGERVKLGNSLRSLDNSLRMLNDVRGTYSQLYSPGTWVQDKINNIIVPVSGGMVRPDVNQAASATRIASALNMVQKQIASANDSGRVAVQEQEWAREMLGGLTNPTAFFSNKDIAAKQFAAMESQLRNARQQVLTQLGYESNDLTMATPSTGTQTDPFVVPADPQQQQMMFRYLSSTIGASQDPRAMVYLQLPNGRIDAFNPVQLRGLVKK
jgi:hypothetical protein